MKIPKVLFSALAIPVLSGSIAFAAAKTYQVTGPVLNLTDDTITVQKGKEKWEIAREPGTQVAGELKKGEKVAIQYRMTAVSVEAKAAAKTGKGKAKKK